MESQTIKELMQIVMNNEDIYSVGIDCARGYDSFVKKDILSVDVKNNTLIINSEDGLFEFNINLIFAIEVM